MVFDWFRDTPSKSQPPQQPPEMYSMTKIQSLLDTLGESRLKVRDPRFKVLLSVVAQQGEPYLRRISVDGNPSETDVMQFQDSLEAAVRVVEQYIAIQNNPSLPDRQVKLDEGLDAIDGFATRIRSSTVPGGTKEMTSFTVDTKILSAQRYQST
jgi:hypothetical protein